MLACAESNFPNFKFEYLRENEFLRKTILACLSGAQMGLICEKKLRSKISWHSPFKELMMSLIRFEPIPSHNLLLVEQLVIARCIVQ